MRIQLFTLALSCAVVFTKIEPIASVFLSPHFQSLAEDTLNLDYDPNLACGGCVRAGYTYCAYKDSEKGRSKLDRCCQSGDFNCMWNQTKNKDTICATQNQTFHDLNKDITEYYKDRYVMVQKFCMKRQNSSVCCPKKKLADGSVMNLRDDGKCEVEIKNKNANLTFSLFLNDLPYGGSCTYEVKTKCGYPQLSVNNSNIDMTVAYKKKEWDNSTYEPSDDDSYSDDETYNPTYKNGKIIFTLDKNAKKDDDDKDEKKCKETKLYLTLTNKLNPNKPQANLSQFRLASALTQVSDSSSQNYAMVVAGAVDGASFLTVFSYFISIAVMSSYFF